jgi:hypothetical protein
MESSMVRNRLKVFCGKLCADVKQALCISQAFVDAVLLLLFLGCYVKDFKEKMSKQEEWARDVLTRNKQLTEENIVMREQLERATKLTGDLKAAVDSSQNFIKCLQEKIDNQVPSCNLSVRPGP